MQSAAMPKTQLASMLSTFASGLSSPKVRLFTSSTNPDANTQYADLTEPTASWYVATNAATFGEVFENDDGSISVQAQSVQFNYSGSDASSEIKGYFITGLSNTLYAARKLDNPVSMATTLDSCIVAPVITVPPVLAN